MPNITVKPNAWSNKLYSYSKRKTLDLCPLKLYAQVTKAYPYKEGPAQKIGNIVDKTLEDAVLALSDVDEKKLYAEIFAADKQYKFIDKLVHGTAECLNYVLDRPGIKTPQQWMGLTSSCKPCQIPHYFSGAPTKIPEHFAPPGQLFDCAGLDLLTIAGSLATVTDYKTGNPNYPDTQQLEDYAVHVFAHFPDIQTVHGEIIFLREGVDIDGKLHIVEKTMKRADMRPVIMRWSDASARVNRMDKTGVWPAQTNSMCNWCEHKPYCEAHVGDEA